MYLVQFSSTRIIGYSDPAAFDRRAKRWLTLREAENSYLLSSMQVITATRNSVNVNLFTLEDDGAIVAAGMLLASGCVCMSWATREMTDLLADHAVSNGWNITSTCAPGHVAWHLAEAVASRTGRTSRFDRAERIYQIALNSYRLPAEGRLELAASGDRQLVRKWVAGFVDEASYELGERSCDQVADVLLDSGSLYLWKTPEPVSMAACVSPTPNGASMNFVYTPPDLRGRGHGKAVSAALCAQMLAKGLKYIFIHADSDDLRVNHIYQSIGGRTLCELLRCNVIPASVRESSIAGNGNLHLS